MYIGQILLFPFDYVPRGYALCDGQELEVTAYPALFALIGTHYGGDGRVTFAVPDCKAPCGFIYCIALYGLWPERP